MLSSALGEKRGATVVTVENQSVPGVEVGADSAAVSVATPKFAAVTHHCTPIT